MKEVLVPDQIWELEMGKEGIKEQVKDESSMSDIFSEEVSVNPSKKMPQDKVTTGLKGSGQRQAVALT